MQSNLWSSDYKNLAFHCDRKIRTNIWDVVRFPKATCLFDANFQLSRNLPHWHLYFGRDPTYFKSKLLINWSQFRALPIKHILHFSFRKGRKITTLDYWETRSMNDNAQINNKSEIIAPCGLSVAFILWFWEQRTSGTWSLVFKTYMNMFSVSLNIPNLSRKNGWIKHLEKMNLA